jgi:hypothetical protein
MQFALLIKKRQNKTPQIELPVSYSLIKIVLLKSSQLLNFELCILNFAFWINQDRD